MADIIVFGSLNADMVFELDRLPRPGMTVLSRAYAVVPGGKGANQAVAAARAGARVRMVGSVGRDGFGDLLVRSIGNASVDATGVARVQEPTGCAAIGVDAEGQNQIMVAAGANLATRSSSVSDEMIIPGATVVMQMEVDPEENWTLARRARARGATTVLNLAPAARLPSDILGDIDILVMNEAETAAVAAQFALGGADPAEMAARTSARFGTTCVVTLGAEGAVALTPDGGWRIGALAIDPVDTTAAGDCFVGWLAARLGSGDTLGDALAWASVASGLACLSRGAQPSLPPHDEVRANLAKLERAHRL